MVSPSDIHNLTNNTQIVKEYKYTTQDNTDKRDNGRSYHYSVNRQGVNKDWNYAKLTNCYEDESGRIDDLIHAVKQGWAINAAQFNGKTRSKAHAKVNGLAILDVDGGLTIQEALEHPLVKRHGLLIYTSPSHKPDHHKFRLIFGLPQQVTAFDYEFLIALLMKEIPQADPACKDAGRAFYGCTYAEIYRLNNEPLPLSILEQARTLAEENRKLQERLREERKKFLEDLDPNETRDLVLQALNYIPPRRPGTNTYSESIRVVFALVNYFGEIEGEAIAESWSPSNRKDKWNISYIVRKNRYQDVGLGTLFYIAQQYGFTFPKKEIKQKFDYLAKLEEDYRKEQELKAKQEEASEKRSFIKYWWEKAQKQLNKRMKRLKIAGLDPSTAKVEIPNTIKFDIDSFPENTESKVIFNDRNQRPQVWLAAKKQGHKTILDSSSMGAGKSHSVPLIGVENGQQLFYIDLNHNNPSIETIEEDFTNLWPRHNGLYRWSDGRLIGEPEYDGQEPEVQSNCFLADQHQAMRSKGYNLDDLAKNPICKRCPFSYKCGKEKGDGYGFKLLRKEALASSKVSGHIEQIPEKTDFSDSIAIIEEASQSLAFTETRTGSIRDIFKQFFELAPDGINEDVLSPVQLELKELLKPLKTYFYQVKQEEISQGRYGIDHDEFLAAVGEAPARLKELLPEIERLLTPNWDELIPEPDSVSGVGGVFREAGEFARSVFRKAAFRESLENLKNLPNNLLFEIIKIWCGGKGSIRINFKTISVTIPYTRHKQLLDKFGYRILLDATANKAHLEKMLDCKILEVQQKQPNLDNLTVLNIQTEGLGSSQISGVAQARFTALEETFKQKFGAENLAVIGNKKDGDESYWFVDNRGTNKFEGMPAILAKGAPFPNLGAIKDEFRAMYGNLDNFEDYYNHLVACEVLQLVGRQRPQLYPERGFVVAIACSNLDLSYLHQFGIKVKNQNAVDIAWKAGTAVQQSKIALLTAARGLIEAGGKVTQETLAELADVSQAYVAKLSNSFSNGWKGLKKLLLNLQGGNNSSSNNFSSEQYLFSQAEIDWIQANPVGALASLIKYIYKRGFKTLEELLFSVSKGDAPQILGLLSMLVFEEKDLPDEMRSP